MDVLDINMFPCWTIWTSWRPNGRHGVRWCVSEDTHTKDLHTMPQTTTQLRAMFIIVAIASLGLEPNTQNPQSKVEKQWLDFTKDGKSRNAIPAEDVISMASIFPFRGFP